MAAQYAVVNEVGVVQYLTDDEGAEGAPWIVLAIPAGADVRAGDTISDDLTVIHRPNPAALPALAGVQLLAAVLAAREHVTPAEAAAIAGVPVGHLEHEVQAWAIAGATTDSKEN